MLKYPSDKEKLEEIKKTENLLRIIFSKNGAYTDIDLLMSRNLSEKYKKLMDWDKQILLGPVHPIK